MKKQGGFLLLVMVVTIFTTAAVMFSIRMLDASTSKSGRSTDVIARMETIRQGLIQFAIVNGRLPCPFNGALLAADPASDTGLASPNNATTACANNQAAGVVPWASLGIPREASLDPWGRKFSYRVFQGANGFTRTNGLSCDTAPPNASTYLPCNGTPLLTIVLPTLPNNTEIAFVLISHGESGAGARLPQGGQQTPLPATTNVAERNNYGAAGPFYDYPQSEPAILVGATNHFDDILIYRTLDSLALAAGRNRNWP